jgi:hypothetical protein
MMPSPMVQDLPLAWISGAILNALVLTEMPLTILWDGRRAREASQHR